MATARKSAAKPPVRTASVAKSAPAPAQVKTTKAKAVKAVKPQKVQPSAKPAKESKVEKPRKPKLVRDSFTIPKDEYAVIDALKDRAARLGKAAKKSEVLRAGVKALEAMSDNAFAASIAAVPSIKTGRPAKST